MIVLLLLYVVAANYQRESHMLHSNVVNLSTGGVQQKHTSPVSPASGRSEGAEGWNGKTVVHNLIFICIRCCVLSSGCLLRDVDS